MELANHLHAALDQPLTGHVASLYGNAILASSRGSAETAAPQWQNVATMGTNIVVLQHVAEIANPVQDLACCLLAWLLLIYCIGWKTWKRTIVPMVNVELMNPSKPTMHDDDIFIYKKVGPVWGTMEGRQPSLLVADPDLVKLILIKDFNHFVDRRKMVVDLGDPTLERMLTILKGEEWRQTRNILTPTFTSGKLKQMSNFMEEAAQKLMKNLESSDAIKSGIDLKPKYSGYTMDIIANCAFGIEINSYDENDEFALYVKEFFNQNFGFRFLLLTLCPWVTKYIDISIFPMKAYKALQQTAKDVIQARRSQSTVRNDFLQLVLDAQIEERQRSDVDNKHGADNKILTEDTVVAQCILFLLAGFDTVAVTLNYIFYMLAIHQEYQQNLIEEIDMAISKHGNLGYEVIMNLEYIDMIISETLRFYPIATRIERTCTKEYRLGDILIKEGMIVSIPVYPMHHDENIFPDPEIFDPERFRGENKNCIKSCAYLPFGAGPRNCIGIRFAMMEMKIAIAYTLRNFRIVKCDKTPVALDFASSVPFLKVKEDIILKLEKRISN